MKKWYLLFFYYWKMSKIDGERLKHFLQNELVILFENAVKKLQMCFRVFWNRLHVSCWDVHLDPNDNVQSVESRHDAYLDLTCQKVNILKEKFTQNHVISDCLYDMSFHTMKVSGVQTMWYLTDLYCFSQYILLCYTERHSCRFGMMWGCVNDSPPCWYTLVF